MDVMRIINFLDAFSTSAVSVLVPLLLLERGVGVVEIGLVVSMSPVIFVVSRSIFAAVSDQVGVRKFFVLNGATNVLTVLIYSLASTPLLFSVGKMVEGVRNGAIWAVNRTAVILKRGRRRAPVEMSRIQAIRTAAAAVGIISVGVLLSEYSFEVVLVFFALIGFVLLGVTFLVEGGGRSSIRIKEVFGQLDFRRRSDLLKRTSLVMVLQFVATSIPLTLVFPLFLKNIEFSYWLIGLAIALYYSASAVTAFFVIRRGWDWGTAWLGALLFFIGAALIPFLGGVWAIPLILLMGIGDGVSTPLWEMLVFSSVRSSRDVSSDIALLHTPPNLCNSVGLIFTGMLLERFGYGVVFVSCGVLFLLFFYFSSKLLSESKYF